MERKLPSPVRRVSPAELCKIFNEGQYTERALAGELHIVVVKSRVTQMTYIRNWVPGTESQEIHYVDSKGDILVKAHRFLRPDGQLAASGLADPKRILLNGEIFALETKLA